MQHYTEIGRRAFKMRLRAKSPSGASTSLSSSSSSSSSDDEGANVVEGRDSGNKAQHQQQNNGGSSQRLDDEDANVVEGRAELVRSAFKMGSRVKQHQVESGNILELVKARQTKV
uniref:CACTA en-spm transposon protein n=1 Tax=Globodera pallida TaxID=36090 RepID=A0A183BU57_GLOPA